MSVSDGSTIAGNRDPDESMSHSEGQTYEGDQLAISNLEKSPYQDPDIIFLDVGSSQTRFKIHSAILAQSTELAAKADSNKISKYVSKAILLPELDEGATHALVHFLYTGCYQILNPDVLTDKGATNAYKLDTCVYCAATRFKLPRLADLAKLRIIQSGPRIGIFDVLKIARESAFPGLPEDETWYPTYLEETIMQAALKDPGLFLHEEFVDHVEGNRTYRQVVMKAIVNSYSKGGRSSTADESEVRTPTSELRRDEPLEEPQAQPLEQPIDERIEKPGYVEEPNTIVQESPASAKEAQSIEFLKLDEIEPTVESSPAPAPEPFTDELGFQTSKTYLQQTGKKEPRPTHTRSDSVIQADDVPIPVPAPSEKPEVVVATSPALTNSTDEPAATKKSKKKKKKASVPAVAAS